MLYIWYYCIIASAAGTPQGRAADAKACDDVSGHSVPGSTKAWSDRSSDGEGNRHSHNTDVQPEGGGRTETQGRSKEQAGNGKQAARRALVFVAEDVTATRYWDICILYVDLL